MGLAAALFSFYAMRTSARGATPYASRALAWLTVFTAVMPIFPPVWDCYRYR